MADHEIGVIIADHHPVFRDGLRHLVQGDTALKLVAEAADGEQALALTRQLRPDILLLDAQIPKLTATQALEQLAQTPLLVKVLLMSEDMERQQVVRMLHCGARGLILKNSEAPVFTKAIRCVHKGEFWVERDVLTEWARSSAHTSDAKFRLTARELEVIREILSGGSNRDIATKFSISEHTVKRHLTNIYDKVGCSTRLELSMFAMHHLPALR
jgi:two-component system, NarL family, nitrate/nitrite response regulator NarL